MAPLRPETLSRDPEVAAAYLRDPLNYCGGVRVRVGHEIMRGIARALDGAPGVRLPVLLVHGAADELCSVKGARELLGRLGSGDKALSEYPGALHELFNEPAGQGAAAIAEVVAWLLRHAAS